jgi:hypothetical protein
LKGNVTGQRDLFSDLGTAAAEANKVLLKFYYLNLLLKNNWFFFFKIEDLFFRDLTFLTDSFFFDFSFFSSKISLLFFSYLKVLPVLFKNVRLKQFTREQKIKDKAKIFILLKKGLLFFLRSYEKFLWINSKIV